MILSFDVSKSWYHIKTLVYYFTYIFNMSKKKSELLLSHEFNNQKQTMLLKTKALLLFGISNICKQKSHFLYGKKL